VCNVIGDRSTLKFAFCTCFESRSTNISYLDFSLKPVVFGCLANAIAPPPIALEGCSNPQNSARLLVCTRKKFFLVGGCWFFVSDVIMKKFWAILAPVTWPRVQLLGQSISLKILLKTRLESESFQSLIDFLAFLVQKLRSKIIKLISYQIP